MPTARTRSKPTKKPFVYQKRSKEDIKKRAQQGFGKFDSYTKDNIARFNPEEGNHCIRILPPTWPDADHWGYDIWVVYNIGADNQSYLSLSRMKNEADPIEEERIKAERLGDDEWRKSLTPTRRVACWIIDRDNEEEGPQLWTMPWTFDRGLNAVCNDDRSGEVLYIDEPDQGFDVEFDRKGKRLNTEYIGIKVARRASPIHEDPDIQDKWLQYIMKNPIPDVLQFYSYEHIANIFQGKSDVGVEDEEYEIEGEDEDYSRKQIKSPKRNRKYQVEVEENLDDDEIPWTGDEDETVFDEEEEEEEEEEEYPIRRRRAKNPSPSNSSSDRENQIKSKLRRLIND